MKRIDVIVPCYNYANFLHQCVDSVLNQEGVEVRVLIIDDASTDDSAGVGAGMASEAAGVEFRRHEVNRGHIATYNEGFDWVANDYTLLLSADDLLSPGSLQRATRIMEEHPQIGLAYGQQIAFSNSPPEPKESELGAETTWQNLTGVDFQEMVCDSGANPVVTPSAVVRTRLVQELGGYRADLPHTADMEYWLRIATRASVAILETVQAFKRLHGHNMQLCFTSDSERDLKERLQTFDLHFRVNRPLPPNVDELLRAARRALSREALWIASEAFDRGEADATAKMMKLAVEWNESVKEESAWRRLRWKRKMGPTVWNLLRPLIRGSR